MQQQTESVEKKFHTSIDTLRLPSFIDCMVDGNLNALTISGFPSEVELGAAWASILSEYVDRIGNEEYKLYLGMFKDVSVLRITLKQIDAIVQPEDESKGVGPGILRLGYDEFFHREIEKLLSTKVKLDDADMDKYSVELDKLYKRRSGIKIRLDLKEMAFEALEKKHKPKEGEETPRITREYFTSMLVTLSDFQAKHDLSENMTVGTYCERLKRFNKQNSSIRRK